MLTSGELALIEKVFGSEIDLTRVGIAYGGWPGQGGNAVTPFGSIYFPPSGYRPDYSNTPDEDWLIHEMVHVWQHQHGIDVVGEAIALSAAHIGDYSETYLFTPSSLRYAKFSSFNIEQQARVVQYYFLAKFYGRGPLKDHMGNAEIFLQGLGFPMVPAIPSPLPIESDILWMDDFYGPVNRSSPQPTPAPKEDIQVSDDFYNPVK